ncbi:hypothetical protein QLX08_004382 [Tetragonisca angustula]|uniref:Uncharacterized protein n=1 Tax=Tetragonisca angustula TaxID=166442 RepID=A0AAW1A2F9_9HYME
METTLISSIASVKETIREIRRISNNGVLVGTTSKVHMKLILKNEKLQATGLITGQPAEKRPMVITYDVSTNFSGKEFLSSLCQQNLDSTQKSKFQKEVKLSHKTGNRNVKAVN